MAIYDVTKINGANDLVADAPQVGGDWIEVDGDGDASTTNDKVLVNKATGDVYIGDNCKGTVNMSEVLKQAYAQGLDANKGINEVILDDDNGETATVNINVDINKLILDNDALNGGTAKTTVNISSQKEELYIISDSDAKDANIAAKDSKAGVQVDLNVQGNTKLNFSGSNDTDIKTTDKGAEGLDVQNVFNVNLIDGDHIISGEVSQNNKFEVGTASTRATINWDKIRAAIPGWAAVLQESNTLVVQEGAEYNGKIIAKASWLPGFGGIQVTYDDGTTENIMPTGGQSNIIFIDPDSQDKTLYVARSGHVAYFGYEDGVVSGLNTDNTNSKLSADQEKLSSDGQSSVLVDPLNSFSINKQGNSTANVKNFMVHQDNTGTVGSNAAGGSLVFRVRNEIGGDVLTKENADQKIGVTLLGNKAGKGIGFTDDSGNWVGKDNLTDTSNTRINVKGDSLNQSQLGGLQTLKDTKAITIEEPTAKDIPELFVLPDNLTLGGDFDPAFLDKIREKLGKLSESAKIPDADFKTAVNAATTDWNKEHPNAQVNLNDNQITSLEGFFPVASVPTNTTPG